MSGSVASGWRLCSTVLRNRRCRVAPSMALRGADGERSEAVGITLLRRFDYHALEGNELMMNPGSADDVEPAEAAVARGPASRVDFANRSRDHVLVVGWILGLAKQVARAEIRYGEVVLDLMRLGFPVPRPDVSERFAATVASPDDNHGFYLLVDLPELEARTSYLRLSVTLYSGESADTVWPVSGGHGPISTFFERNAGTLKWLYQSLKAGEAARLRELVTLANSPESTVDRRGGSPQLRYVVDLCCLLSPQIVVLMGRLDAQHRQLTSASFTAGGAIQNVLGDLEIAPLAAGESPARTLRDESVAEIAFSVVTGVLSPAAPAAEVALELADASGYGVVRRILHTDLRSARSELLAKLKFMDEASTIDLIERIAALAGDSPEDRSLLEWLKGVYDAAIERLPVSLNSSYGDVFLHCDSVIPIVDAGIFLKGWFHAREGAVLCVACHGGFRSVLIDKDWVRHARRDVSTHLASLGLVVAGHDHGIACFVSLGPVAAPYFLSVTTVTGAMYRVRLPKVAALPALDAVRGVLTSFEPSHRALLELLDRQVGPAVQQVWAERRKLRSPVTWQRFGPPVPLPAVSVIVPLYGRYDFAEYQLAQFADDADFQGLELIYFVDDPTIYDEFRAQCDGLYQLYRVPFTLAFSGANLGFAGANNAAASFAGGRHFLLLNSDVLPKYPGWVAELLNRYATLKKPGCLGAKLLYEDDSVQHAGMIFRRHAPWGDLWINDHPHKGQSGLGLSGMRRVDAVTAACLLVSADLYRDAGGLSEDYVIGDFEDSDFCLKVTALGRRNWVALDTELYHLERQSQTLNGDAHWRTNLTLYNCWQHSQRWGSHLESRGR